MKKIWKKLLAITLALSMTMSMVSITSLAVEGEEGTAGKVTLTYNANAGTDEVRGLPADQEVKHGETVTVSDYRGMSRPGYKPLGWSTTRGAEQPDVGATYTLTADTTLYAVWKVVPEEGDGTVEVDSYEKLTAAITAAGTTPTTIKLTQSIVATSHIQITSDQVITITSDTDGVTLSRGEACKGLFIYNNEGTLTLQNIVIDGANVPAKYAAIYNYKATTTIAGSVVQNCVSTSNGGGVYSTSTGTLTITDSTFTGNTASKMGGGVYSTGKLTITGGTFSDNEGGGRVGGAVYSGNKGSANKIADAEFTGNAPGAVSVSGGTLEGLSIAENTGNGPALKVSNTVTVEDCEIRNNVNNEPYYENGGAVFVGSNSAATFKNCTIAGNTGAMCGGMSVYRTSSATLDGTVIKNNTATAEYSDEYSSMKPVGGIYVDASASLTFQSGALYSNQPIDLFRDAGGKSLNVLDAVKMVDPELGDDYFADCNYAWQRNGEILQDSVSAILDSGEIRLIAVPQETPTVNNVYLDGVNGSDSQDGSRPAFAVKTLERAVALAKEHEVDTIYVSGAVTLTGDVDVDGNGLTLMRHRSNTGNMLTIRSGNVTLKNITIDGNKGECLKPSGALIEMTGGTLNLEAGAVLQNNVSNGMLTGGAVKLDNATLNMTGGTIQNVDAGDNTQMINAPVVVGDEAVFNMSGGVITGNWNYTVGNIGAGAVLVYGWSESSVGGKMTLTGDAVIRNNTTSSNCGAVTLAGNAVLNMTGGTISGNHGRNGGGVCVVGRTGGMDKTYDAKCVFTMDGGEISNNTARYGGGIYVNSNHVTLNAGTISGNTAGETGGGVYVETPHGNKTGAHFKNVVISGNTASYMGGGMYFCPTGNASLYVNEGCAIFDNMAVNNTSTNSGMAAADDFVSVVNSNVWSDESKHALLSERALGGGLVQWYLDGSVSDPTLGGGWGGVDSDSVRYDPANPVQVESGDYDTNLALKTVMSDSAKALAIANATLLITGNTANRGGGVGSNGSATMGADPNDPVDPTPSKEYTLKVNKVWENVPESEQKPVTIQLLVEISDKVYELDSVELNKDNNWTGSFEGLPEVVIGKLSIKELVDGYVTDYSEITEDGTELSATVTNRPITYSLTINKVVAGGDDTAAEKTYTFTVEGPNGYKKDDVTITGTGRAILSGLLPGTYTVTENRADADISGYTLEVTGEGEVEVKAENEAVITITNTYEPTYTPPTTTYTSLTVNKVWAGDEGETRPDSVTVQLYRNGAAYESRTLNEANGWSTTWSSLNDDYTWTVGEVNVPEGYTASQSRRGTTVTITNTFTEDVEETDTPTTESPEPTESPDPTESPAPIESPDPTETPNPTETQEPDEGEDLGDNDTPLTELPEVTETPEPTESQEPDEGEDLGDNDTPLADVPQTGDMLWLWMTLAAGSAVSLAWISAEEKKGKRVSK